MRKTQHIGFADLAAEKRKVKSQFFDQINMIVDWRPISNIINKHYQRGESAVGCPAYPGLMLFKMGLLQTWYGLSDYEVEDRVNDSISFSRFIGLSIDDKAPDHSTLSRFRTQMTSCGAYPKLLKALNKQLDKHGIMVRTGAIVDASVTESPFKPKGRTTYEIATDREEEPRSQEEQDKEEKHHVLIRKQQPGVDSEARWLKKRGKPMYGYKRNYVTDPEGLVMGVTTTPANVNEITDLEEVLQEADLPEGIPLMADKGYASKKNREMLKRHKLKDRIQRKAVRGRPLTEWEIKFNKLISKTRYKVERTFGSIKRWFQSTKARYRGLAKTHTQHVMEAMAYNLYRSPGIVVSKSTG
jgi:IS5 family transposase